MTSHPVQPAEIYAWSQVRLAALLAGLPEDDLARPVPACPAWTVRDLAAHLAGVAADARAGADFAADSRTAQQVAERAELPLAMVLGAWADDTPALAVKITETGGWRSLYVRLPLDAVSHEADLLGALGRSPAAIPEAHVVALARVAALALRSRTEAAGLPAPAVDTPDFLIEGSTPQAPRVRTSAFELLRGLFGRRSAAQVLRWSWTGDPEPYLGLLSAFGRLPAGDVVA